MVETFGTGKLSDTRLTQIVRANFDLTPFGLREMLDLARPIYQKPPPTAISAARKKNLPGNAPTRPKRLPMSFPPLAQLELKSAHARSR
jgi:hypothetical protein